MGTRKASRDSGSAQEKADSVGQAREEAKNEPHRFGGDVFPGPLRGAEQRRSAGGLRRALFEGQSPELRSRALSDATHREEVLLGCPAFRVAQGTPEGGTDPGVAFSLATFFWPHKRKYARPQGGTPSQFEAPSQSPDNNQLKTIPETNPCPSKPYKSN